MLPQLNLIIFLKVIVDIGNACNNQGMCTVGGNCSHFIPVKSMVSVKQENSRHPICVRRNTAVASLSLSEVLLVCDLKELTIQVSCWSSVCGSVWPGVMYPWTNRVRLKKVTPRALTSSRSYVGFWATNHRKGWAQVQPGGQSDSLKCCHMVPVREFL